MYYIYGQSGPSLLIESTDSMILTKSQLNTPVWASLRLAPINSVYTHDIVFFTCTSVTIMKSEKTLDDTACMDSMFMMSIHTPRRYILE